jgi:hypothetical protein
MGLTPMTVFSGRNADQLFHMFTEVTHIGEAILQGYGE